MHERRGCLPQLLGLLGVVFILQLVLPATGLQGKLNRWLTAPEWRIEDREAAVVVVLGGGGIPSESGLIRTWYGADAYEEYPHATYIVCLPAGDNPEEDSVGLMRDELVMRGVPSEQVLLETRGRNTREQASEVHKILQERGDTGPVLVVSSPYHLRRSIQSFHAAGLTDRP